MQDQRQTCKLPQISWIQAISAISSTTCSSIYIGVAIYHRFLYRSADGSLPGDTFFAGLTGVELACGTINVLLESDGCFLGGCCRCCSVGGSGVLVCRLGLGSSLMGFRRILSEKHLSRGELEIKGINAGSWENKRYSKNGHTSLSQWDFHGSVAALMQHCNGYKVRPGTLFECNAHFFNILDKFGNRT